jgi:hypothetical protein
LGTDYGSGQILIGDGTLGFDIVHNDRFSEAWAFSQLDVAGDINVVIPSVFILEGKKFTFEMLEEIRIDLLGEIVSRCIHGG